MSESGGGSIADIQRAQQAMMKLSMSFKPGNGLTRAVKFATIAAHRYVVTITHVWRVKGGALRASQRFRIDARESNVEGVIYIDETSINPRGQRPYIYGRGEHARGGSHAFYARTEREYGRNAASLAETIYKSELP